MCSKYEFCDWMPYEEKYWRDAPLLTGVVETRPIRTSGVKSFIGGPLGETGIRGYLARRDPEKNRGNLSGWEKHFVADGGELEVRFALTTSIEEAVNLKKCLIHRYKEKHGRLPCGQIQTPRLCPRSRSGGCTICKE